MEIICAGYWKTGSKSCTSALRELGFKVADATETAYEFGEVWVDFLSGKCPIEDVIVMVTKIFLETNFNLYFV